MEKLFLAGFGVFTFLAYPVTFAFYGLIVSLVFYLIALTGVIVMPFAFATPIWIGALIGLGIWLIIGAVVAIVARFAR